MLDTPTLYRLAGWSSAIAIVTLIISGIALAIFFSIGEPWGSINDFFIVLTALALIPPMLAIDRIAGDSAAWLRPVTILAIAGAVLIAVGQSLLIVRVIDLNASYVTGGVGVLPVLAWLVALVVLAFGTHGVAPAIGWTALAALGAIVVFSLIAVVTLGPVLWVASIVLLLAISAWMGAMSMDLLGRAPA
jgi:hypothetical protein